MRRVLAANAEANVFYIGFKACDDYAGGDAAMVRVQCETLFILGRNDQMTLPRAAQGLISRASRGKVVEVEAGHQLMLEAPDAVLAALKEYLRS